MKLFPIVQDNCEHYNKRIVKCVPVSPKRGKISNIWITFLFLNKMFIRAGIHKNDSQNSKHVRSNQTTGFRNFKASTTVP